MRSLVYIIFFLGITATSHASVEVVSYYFQGNSIQLTQASLDKIIEFQEKINLNGFQLIEFNSYTQRELERRKSVQLAAKRVNLLLYLFSAEEDPITVNILGNQRKAINFKPKHWNRVDIYYFIPEKEPSTKENNLEKQITKAEPEVIPHKLPIHATPEKMEDHELLSPPAAGTEKMDMSTPLVLPILFVGDTWKIKDESLHLAYDLQGILKKHPTVNAHIRGHVCCGRNKRISRNRAKAVYDFLLEEGISKERISFKGYSNDIPLVYPERSAKDRSLNRRVDVLFSDSNEKI